MTSTFNGGKMNHIWVPNRNRYEPVFTSLEAERCLKDKDTDISLKVDGECACLIRQEIDNDNRYEWVFCRRQDNYKGAEHTISIPKGQQPASFQKHNYSFLPLSKTCITGKGKKRSSPGPDTYKAIEFGNKTTYDSRSKWRRLS